MNETFDAWYNRMKNDDSFRYVRKDLSDDEFYQYMLRLYTGFKTLNTNDEDLVVTVSSARSL